MAKNKGRKNRDGAEAQRRKQERLEARRQAKAEAEARQRRVEARARAVRAVMLVGLGLLAVWFLFLRGGTPDEIGGHELTKFSGAGVNEHVEGSLSYEMTPPVQGAHNPQPAGCGVYAEPLPNENFVHSLEHGAVALLYDPARAGIDDIRALEELARGAEDGVVSAPFDGMEPVFSIVSWGERMDLDELDLPAVREYISEFRNKGPEPGVDCPKTSDSAFQEEADPEPAPSPTPTS